MTMHEQSLIAFCIGDGALATQLPATLAAFPGIPELAVLSTCNRFELYGVCPKDYPAEQLVKILGKLQELDKGASAFPLDQLRNFTYTHTGRNAIHHLFAVAASVDSLVVGETQITGQFKRSLQLASDAKTLGPLLHRLGQEALATAKKIRNQTDIGRQTVSISHAAIELAAKIFGDISEHHVLLVGAGEMARVAGQHVLRYQPKSLSIANRTVENAEKLVTELQFGKAFALEELSDLLVTSDIVICSTSSQQLVITSPLMRQTFAARRGKPQILIDISIPRNIDPKCSEIGDLYLFDVDDLQQVVASHADERHQAARQAIGIIDEQADALLRWWDALSLKPVLAAFNQYLQRLSEQEFQRTKSKEIMKNLSDGQNEAINALLASITNKIAADVGRTLMQPPSSISQLHVAESLKAIMNKQSDPAERQVNTEGAK
jgi:glutamyl-tRNA reductase